MKKNVWDVYEKNKFVEKCYSKIKKKVSPDNNSVKFKCFFLILTLENAECVSWYMITQKWKKKSMYLYDFRVYPIYVLIIAKNDR